MRTHLESGLTIDCPKGPTYLRPEDHQGLAEMYIATAVNDTVSGSETENMVIAELVQTLDRFAVAPPIASNYTPGGGTATPFVLDPMTLAVIGIGVVAIIIVVGVIFFRKK